MNYTFYELAMLFFTYSFLAWLAETAVATVKVRNFRNRGFVQVFWLFLIGAFAGDIVETIFCRVTSGVWMSRSSLVWGPFSVVWGLVLALVRYDTRVDGKAAVYKWEQTMDEHFDDAKMERIYPNAIRQ